MDGRRYVSLKIGHVGIEKECINEVILSQDFSKHFNTFFASLQAGKKVIAAVDYLHPMSGITNKLRGIQEFLRGRRDKVDDVVFIQYIVPPRGMDQ